MYSEASFKSRLSGSDEESSSIETEDMDDWDIYEKDFDQKQFKKT